MPDRALAQFDYLDEQVALCLATRDRLRANIPLQDRECEIEYDEIAHPASGHIFVCITEDGRRPGDAHGESDDIIHYVYGIKVTVFYRVAHLPRDRKMHAVLGDHQFLIAESGLNRMVTNVEKLIDKSYQLNLAATALLEESGDTRQGFQRPFIWTGTDSEPRIVQAIMFASQQSTSKTRSDGDVALAKTIRFNGCDRQIARDNVLS